MTMGALAGVLGCITSLVYCSVLSSLRYGQLRWIAEIMNGFYVLFVDYLVCV